MFEFQKLSFLTVSFYLMQVVMKNNDVFKLLASKHQLELEEVGLQFVV